MRGMIILAAALALSGCASDAMERYLGQPLQAVMIRNGPPTNAFDMPDGRRAFQWVKSASYVTPTNVSNYGSVTPVGNTLWWNQNTQITGGVPITHQCAYTMYGRWDEASNTWIMDGFETPNIMCE